jgi:hypothetical protein
MSSKNSTFFPRNLAAAYFGGQSFKFLLVSAVPSEANLDAWEFRNQITNEVTGTGYTTGGVPVTLTVGAVDTTNNRVPVTATNLAPMLATASVTAVGGWIYRDTGNATTDALVQFVDFGESVTSTNAAFNASFTVPLYITAL